MRGDVRGGGGGVARDEEFVGDVDEAQRATQHEEQVPHAHHSSGISGRPHVPCLAEGVWCSGMRGDTVRRGKKVSQERPSDMRIGILGSGLMGAKLGTIWARAGHDVVFSYSRSDAK